MSNPLPGLHTESHRIYTKISFLQYTNKMLLLKVSYNLRTDRQTTGIPPLLTRIMHTIHIVNFLYQSQARISWGQGI